MSPNQYVNTLPQKVQEVIWKYLYDMDAEELTIHDINNAMNSRICDLEEWLTFKEVEALSWEVSKYA